MRFGSLAPRDHVIGAEPTVELSPSPSRRQMCCRQHQVDHFLFATDVGRYLGGIRSFALPESKPNAAARDAAPGLSVCAHGPENRTKLRPEVARSSQFSRRKQ